MGARPRVVFVLDRAEASMLNGKEMQMQAQTDPAPVSQRSQDKEENESRELIIHVPVFLFDSEGISINN